MGENPHLELWAEMLEIDPDELRQHGLAWFIRAVEAKRTIHQPWTLLRLLARFSIPNFKSMVDVSESDLPDRIEVSLADGHTKAAIDGLAEWRLDEEAATRFVAMLERMFWPERPDRTTPISADDIRDYRRDFPVPAP